jgi:hypothetical protein
MPIRDDTENPWDETISITIACSNLRVDIPAEQALSDETLIERVFDLVLDQPGIHAIELRYIRSTT